MTRGRRGRSSIREKIVLPFFVLLAFVGMVGTALITNRATTATVSTFEGSLLRASLLSNDHLAVLEAERLAQLRAAIDTQGVAPALAAHDTDSLTRLIRPVQANAALNGSNPSTISVWFTQSSTDRRTPRATSMSSHGWSRLE